MKSVLMMSGANIRKRKVQSILVLITIVMTSLLLATAIGILDSINDPFQTMFEQQKGSHLTLQVSSRHHDLDQIVHWWQQQQAVDSVQLTPYYWVEDQVSHNGTLQSMGNLMLAAHPGGTLVQDQLQIVDGQEQTVPGENEIWIPTGYSYAWDIKPGDDLEITINGERKLLTVSAIIVDPQYSVSMMNPIRAWVPSSLVKDSQTQAIDSFIQIRFSDYSQYEPLWVDFESYLGSPLIGYILNYEGLQNSYGIIEGIVGAIMLLFSIIIILVAVSVITFTIANTIILDYKIIGILRAQGFSAGNVKSIYTLQYLLLALISVPLGIILSKPVVKEILSQLMKSLGIARLDASLFLPALLTSVTLMTIILVTAYWSSSKAGNIEPAQAIRSAAPVSKGGRGKRFDITTVMALPLSLLLGLKNTLTGKRHSLFMVASAAILAFVLAFSINTYNSVKSMEDNLAFWGFDNGDIFISRDSNLEKLSHQQVLAPLYADDRVVAAVANSALTTSIPAQSGKSSTNVVVFAYAGDMDSIGIQNLEGKSPARDNEVSLSFLTARKYDKSIGDMIELFIEGSTDNYLVTGIYQSINAMGLGFRIQESAITKINPEFLAETYSVKLQDGVDSRSFINDIRQEFGGYNIRTASDSGEINLSSITGYMALIVLTLSIIFMAVAFVIIFNATLMSIYSDRKNFGIYKALGMTPVQIRMSIVSKVLALSLIGVALGLPLALILTPRVLSMLVMDMGLVNFPFDLTLLGTLSVVPLSIAVTFISSWIPSGRILKLNPRNLIID